MVQKNLRKEKTPRYKVEENEKKNYKKILKTKNFHKSLIKTNRMIIINSKD